MRPVPERAHDGLRPQGGQDRADRRLRRPVPGGCGAAVRRQQSGGADDRHPAQQFPGEAGDEAGGDAGHPAGHRREEAGRRRGGGGGGRPHPVPAPLRTQDLRFDRYRQRGAEGPYRGPVLPGGEGQAGPVRHRRHHGVHPRRRPGGHHGGHSGLQAGRGGHGAVHRRHERGPR